MNAQQTLLFASTVIWIIFVYAISILLHEFGHYLVFSSRNMVRGYGVYISCPAIDNSGYDAVGVLSGFFFGCLAYPIMFLHPFASKLMPLSIFVAIQYSASIFDFWNFMQYTILGKPYKPPPVKRGLLGWWWYVPLKKDGV